MFKRFIYCSYVFSFILISSIVYSAPLEPGEWLKTWKICGPISLQHLDYGTDVTHLGGFEIDYLDKQGGEENLDIDKKNSEFNWFQHTSDTEIINLRKNLADQLYACAYAYCKVESPEQKNYIFTCGTDDGGRVWLNGDQIWDSPLRGKTIPDEHRIAVNLRKGENTILFKVENHTGNWSFLCPFSGFKY